MTYVVTPYAREASWLIFQLKEIFKEHLDYMNKYPFYGRLAEAANAALAADAQARPAALWAAIMEEAKKLSAETEEEK